MTIDSSPCEILEKEQSTKHVRSSLSICQHDRRGREPLRARRRRRDTNSPPFSSLDSHYSPSLGQVLIGQEGAFRNTRSRVAVPYNYEQSSSSTGVMSLEPLKGLFQWSDDEGEVSGYASSTTVSSVQTGRYWLTWPITAMMTFVDGWRLKSKPPRPRKKPWIVSNKF